MIQIEPSWATVLKDELSSWHFKQLSATLRKQYKKQQIYPPYDLIFNAFTLCPFTGVKVVILGQDPYHGANQAHGLAFSVPNDTQKPPSLRNIFKELESDLGVKKASGNLEEWAKQGVLLLNTTLTVAAGSPGSHQNIGWNSFTDTVIKQVADNKDHVVFILWGKSSQAKSNLINTSHHLILTAPHPSPLSAHSGFFGSKPFSQTNAYLKRHGLPAIEW